MGYLMFNFMIHSVRLKLNNNSQTDLPCYGSPKSVAPRVICMVAINLRYHPCIGLFWFSNASFKILPREKTQAPVAITRGTFTNVLTSLRISVDNTTIKMTKKRIWWTDMHMYMCLYAYLFPCTYMHTSTYLPYLSRNTYLLICNIRTYGRRNMNLV